MKAAPAIDQRIFRRISRSGDGCGFMSGQFLDLGNRSAVGVGLHRLARAGKIAGFAGGYSTSFVPDAAGYIRRAVKIELGARADHWPCETKLVTPYVAEQFP